MLISVKRYNKKSIVNIHKKTEYMWFNIITEIKAIIII